MSEAIEYNAGEGGAAAAAAAAAVAQAEATAHLAHHEVIIAEAESGMKYEADEGLHEESIAPAKLSEHSKSYTETEEKGLDAFYMCLDSLKVGGVVQKGHNVVKVLVGDPQNQKTLTGSFTTYAVTIEPRIEEIKFVRRRYRDFVWLRKWVCEAFPCIFVPPLPPKSLLNKMKESFIEERRAGLQEFLQRLISRHRFLVHSLPFQLFVSKHSNTFDKQKRDIEKLIYEQSDDTLGTMYQSLFPEYTRLSLPKEPEERVLRLKDYLTNSAKQVTILLDSSSQIAEKWSDISTHSSKVTDSLKSLSKVENGYAQRPEPQRMDVIGKFESWAGIVSEKPKQWSDLVVEIFKSEKLDIEAMLLVVKQWECIHKRLAKAKDRVAKYAKIEGEMNEKQRASQKKDKKAEEEIKALHAIVTKILFESEVVYYWENRTCCFNMQIQTFFKTQLEISSKLARVWSENKSIDG